ncbi:hypothetical protein M569_10569 [Genlisea aurea]|uniref:UBZ4-type domain-containing protein n=1 Tax=Genlisea aurea TaxID=192259 RepID=S8CHW2_9LAMI|nr:hypothetical protein M569_10569 [Genlisea aurea]
MTTTSSAAFVMPKGVRDDGGTAHRQRHQQMFFSTEKCLSDPSEKLTTVTGITLSDDAADLPPKFTIRDYVFNSRAEDLESYWPFSKRSLQICLKHGVRDVLPPYQSLRSLRNQMVMEDVRKLSKLRINGGLESEEFTSSKVCPVCKAFSSPSNTTLNAHIDQCLAAAAEPAAESASKKPGAKHGGGGRTERRKVRSMADVYAAARRCTLEDLDRRNGTKWSGGDRAPSDRGGLEERRAPRRAPRRTRGRVSEDGSGGAVYFDSDGTKLRILSKLDDRVVGGDDDDDGKRSRSSRGKTASRRHKTSEEEEEFPETDGDGERENGCSGYRSEKRVRWKKTTDENRECSSISSHEEYVVEPPSRPKKKKKPRPESEKRATSARTSARSNRGPPDDDGGDDDEEDEDAFFSRKRKDHDGAADSDRFVDYPVEEPHPGLLFSGLSSQDSSLFFSEFPTAVVEEIAIPGPPGSFLPSPGRGGNSFVSCCEDGDGFGNGCDSSLLLAYDPDDEGGITNRAPSGCGQVGGGGGVLRLMGKDLMVAPSSQVTMQTGGSLRLQRHRPSLVTAAMMMRDAYGAAHPDHSSSNAVCTLFHMSHGSRPRFELFRRVLTSGAAKRYGVMLDPSPIRSTVADWNCF